jgi:hypothetical protein
VKNVFVVRARCGGHNRLSGVRMEEQWPGHWAATWAFPLREDVAKREGYEARTIEGAFGFSPGYPGSSSCEAGSFYVCGCGATVCWNAVDRVGPGPSCGSNGELSGVATVIRRNGDR